MDAEIPGTGLNLINSPTLQRLTALLDICTFILLYLVCLHRMKCLASSSCYIILPWRSHQPREVPKKCKQEDPRHRTNPSRSHHFMGAATEIARRAITLISRAYSPHAWITRSLGLAAELVHHLNMNFLVETTFWGMVLSNQESPASLGHSCFANTKPR